MEIRTFKGSVVWFTGMSGAGKSTIAHAFVEYLKTLGIRAKVLDGDALRTGLNADLGFSTVDRTENLRRIAHVAALFCDEGYVVVTATISPEAEHRDNARRIAVDRPFVEVFIDTSPEVCERRDPKGLYKRARRGEIPCFTGVGATYHAPRHPDVTLRTEDSDVAACVQQLIDHLAGTGVLGPC
ncbi:MAG TPA: adenylyl-sulfate kinase [Rhodocyclaceae bacterium]|nr:adenylyl-sulfate kinase [Rhodocyclaceae bacterium]